MRFKHVWTVFSQVGIIIALVACNSSVSADKTACPDSAQQYWKKFRTTVLQNNTNGVADLTQFPFIMSSGIVDEDRRNKPIQRAEFLKQYPHLLTRDPGLSLEPSTMWDLIKSNERLTAAFCAADDGQFRVGDWVFQKESQNWRFVQAYVGEE